MCGRLHINRLEMLSPLGEEKTALPRSISGKDALAAFCLDSYLPDHYKASKSDTKDSTSSRSSPGQVVMVYYSTDGSHVEVWFHDISGAWWYLSPDFTRYFRLLLANYGVTGWQYANTKVSVRGILTFFVAETLSIHNGGLSLSPDALIVSQSVVSAVLVVAALLTAFWVNKAKSAIPYTEILTETEEGRLEVEKKVPVDSCASQGSTGGHTSTVADRLIAHASSSSSSEGAPATTAAAEGNFTIRVANGVLNLLVLVLWYWSTVISIGSSKSHLMWSLFGLIAVYMAIAVAVKVIHLSDHSIKELNKTLRCQAGLGICYIIQLPTMWAYHSEVWLSMIVSAMVLLLLLDFNTATSILLVRAGLYALLIAGSYWGSTMQCCGAAPQMKDETLQDPGGQGDQGLADQDHDGGAVPLPLWQWTRTMITLSLQDSCIAIFATVDQGIGVNLVGTPVEWSANFQWSSSFTRALTFHRIPCQRGDVAPCHIYLTAARNLSSEMIINAHFSYSDTRKVEFVYRDSSDGVEHREGSQHFWVPVGPTRDMHVMYLSDLPPGAVIEFWIVADGEVVSDVRRFRTAPVTGEVTIAVGGDAGANDLGQHVSEQMARYSPYAAVFAGDVSYDNSLIGCACIWDKFLTSWDKIRVKPKDENFDDEKEEGFMIPLIFTTGNHDLGVNEKPKSERYPSHECNMGVLSKIRPLFYGYFAFEAPNGKVPRICDRSHSHVHLIGDSTVLWALDSDYALPALDTRDWLRSTLADINYPTERPLRHLAAYHLPMYPSLRDEAAWKQGARLREVWEDEFAKLGLKAAFEHHVHSFKRTKPLLRGQPIDAASGNGFVGDGKWGVLPRDSPGEDILVKEDSRFAKLGTHNHVWIAKIDLAAEGKITLIAVNEDGVEVDIVSI
ncbi:hypothetical protein FOL47_009921 [Perkinsus chesapeaki]|uniref:Purple acid phosphatase n=1 Tax=Perkinsus chesapeaki TaxID=330153 RepID=A0A7J6L5S1_PERCH|nr:hypothetical protein FOL47_009921 [Perkinsus chesapeaki]